MYTPEQTQAFHYYVQQGYDQNQALQLALQQFPSAAPAAAPVAQAPAVAPVAQAVGNALLAIANEVAEDEDHAAVQSGGLAKAGPCQIRFLGYIETGVHQPKNPQHNPKANAQLIVELHSAQHMRNVNGVMEPAIETIRVSKTHGANSGFPKLFKVLRDCFPNDNITHMSQLLGKAVLGTIYHNKVGDTTYANFDKDGAWSFAGTSGFNQDGTQYNVEVPPLRGEPKLFLYECPKTIANPAHMKAMWDSIYVDGIRTWKDQAGEEKSRSNNYHQELLSKSLQWGSSETKRVLDQLGCVTDFGLSADVHTQEADQALASAIGQPQLQSSGMHMQHAEPAMVQQPTMAAAPMAQPMQAVPTQTPVVNQHQAAALVQQAIPQHAPVHAPAAEQPAMVQNIAAQQADFVPATPTAMQPLQAPVQAVQQPMVAPVTPQPAMVPAEQAAVQQFNAQVAPQAAPQPMAAPQMMDPSAFVNQYT